MGTLISKIVIFGVEKFHPSFTAEVSLVHIFLKIRMTTLKGTDFYDVWFQQNCGTCHIYHFVSHSADIVMSEAAI